jgi:hypothetical protein
MSHYIPSVNSGKNQFSRTIENQDEICSTNDKEFVKNFEKKFINQDLSSHKTSTYTSKTLLNKILEFLRPLFYPKHHNETQKTGLLSEDIGQKGTTVETTSDKPKQNSKQCENSTKFLHKQDYNSKYNQSEVTVFDAYAEGEDQSLDLLIKNKSLVTTYQNDNNTQTTLVLNKSITSFLLLGYQQKGYDEFILVNTGEIMQEIRESKESYQFEDHILLMDYSGKSYCNSENYEFLG